MYKVGANRNRTLFARDPSYEYAWVLRANLLCRFRHDVIWSFFSPIWSHINENKKKWQNLKFRQSLKNFSRDPPYKYEWFLEWICYVLSEEMSLEVFLLYSLMSAKRKHKSLNIKNAKIWKTNKKMVWGYGEKVPFHQIDINLLDGFCENGFYGRADGQTAHDGLPRDDSSSAVQ